MAAKKDERELYLLCHPLALTHVSVPFQKPTPPTHSASRSAVVENRGPTGVEMEVLTAVQVAHDDLRYV
jgi:cyclic pyranopterin phosphate synthase